MDEEASAYHLNSIYKKLNAPNYQESAMVLAKLYEPFDTSGIRSSRVVKALTNSDNSKSKIFQQLYDKLDVRNVKELPRYVSFLTYVKRNEDVLNMLRIQKSEQKENIGANKLSRFNMTKSIRNGSSSVVPGSNSSMSTNKFICLNYVESSAIGNFPNPTVPLNSLSSYDEDSMVTKDLISCLMNGHGIYIRPLYSPTEGINFSIDNSMSPSNRGIAEEIIKICVHTSVVARFIDDFSGYECGSIKQALSSALAAHLRQFRLEVCRAQSAALLPPSSARSLQSNQQQHQLAPSQLLSMLAQGPETTIKTLSEICRVVREHNLHGGTLLTHFCRKLSSNGSPQDRLLYSQLMQCITVPFFRMLRLWIYRGIISDPYKEFFICENPIYTLTPEVGGFIGHEYWMKRYSTITSLVPKFLETHVQNILNTGKYLNVIQMTGVGSDETICCLKLNEDGSGDAAFATIEDMVYETEERHYETQITEAYKHASYLLMDIMFKEKKLMDHFKFMKHYFLLYQADWLSHFMDLASSELSMKSSNEQIGRLQSLLDVAVQAGCNLNENLRDHLNVELSQEDLMFLITTIVTFNPDSAPQILGPTGKNLTVLEAFCLSVSFEWPISLVFDSFIMQHYQILFRHLFYCHHVERVLSVCWLTNKCSSINPQANSHIINKANVLGGRMRTFVQNLLYFMTIEVIEPGWIVLEDKINLASNIDAIFSSHKEFLNYCFLNCLLTFPLHLKNLQKILLSCVLFANKFNRLLNSNYLVLKNQSSLGNNEFQEESIDNFERQIRDDDRNFTELINAMIRDIRKDNKRPKHLNNLLMRLEFNNFYDSCNTAISASNSMA